MTARDDSLRPGEERTRQGYLKLKSVLHDRATGLPAFPVLIDRLRNWLDDRRRVGLLFLRVEGLEQVESLYGWQVLDRILRRISETLEGARADELGSGSRLAVDRIAGTGFLAFIPEMPRGKELCSEELRQAGERLARRLRTEFKSKEFAGLNPVLEFSVGQSWIALDPFRRFERQVYAAIEEARGYEEEQQRRREYSWSQEVRRIIDESAVESVFQPVVELQSRGVIGYEALARGPRDTPLESPRALFEWSGQAGLETELDLACCAAAIRSAPAVSDKRKLFVNALTVTMEETDRAAGELFRWMEEVALDPSDLVLEFSERGADEDPDRFVRVIGGLKARGIAVALDDVGTGYATQAVLEGSEPDYLKLDVSLVREIHTHLIKQDLLHSLVRIAGRIGAEVIGEGVETEDEARVLHQAGARLAQGFLFGPPLAADRVATHGRPGERDT